MQTVCTMCNKCCDKGANCEWNGVTGEYLRQCGCKTSMVGCKSCGICGQCANELWVGTYQYLFNSSHQKTLQC